MERIEQLLNECGNTWLGGQREQIRCAMLKLVEEQQAPKLQTRRQSMVEVVTSLAVGFFIALALQTFLMWFYDLPATHGQNVMITVWFTVVSIIRGYAVRRFFNRRHR